MDFNMAGLPKNAHYEKRRHLRLPLSISLCLKQDAGDTLTGVQSIDLNQYGARIESERPLTLGANVELWPREAEPVTGVAIKGRVLWVKPEKKKFRGGIVFDKTAQWPVPLPEVVQGLGKTPFDRSLSLQDILNTLDDGILILDPKLNIIAANDNQPFCLPREHQRLRGESAQKISPLFKTKVGEGLFKDLVQMTLRTSEEIKLPALEYSGPEVSRETQPRYYTIWLSPFSGPLGIQGVVLRSRDVTTLRHLEEKEKAREDFFWLQYRYITLGQLFDGLLDDLINPLSAIVGRLDLLALKMSGAEAPTGKSEVEGWQADLDAIQNILGHMTEFCRAAARRRTSETLAMPACFSLNALVERELQTLELRSHFKKISKHLSLLPTLPLLHGSYGDWANAFVALCQIIARQMAALDTREMKIQTSVEGEALVLRFSHNGKALGTPLDRDPDLTILRLLKKKYGVSVSVSGSSGLQTIALRVPVRQESSPSSLACLEDQASSYPCETLSSGNS
jgi:signal transduction histidine kinase